LFIVTNEVQILISHVISRQVYQKVKRRYDFKSKLPEIVSALVECKGKITDCWPNENSLWGNVLQKCGYPNTDKARKALYMMWRKNWGCIREKYQERLESVSVAQMCDANHKVKYSSYI
jgi:hypothetical protein